MSYLVLARKYRPRNFSELVGQEHVVQALTNALTQQRLHHAYMFTGTRGVGKTTVSRILAKSLNCTGPDGAGGITATPCGQCPACTQIDAGRFVDYTELDAASNRGVDEVQQLLEQAVYKPVEGRFKVFMIDEVHMLTNTAFNAMLKTLEEPPEYLKFVLATTDPQKVPVTVLSRCLQFNLRPMAPDTIFEHLQHVLQAEQVTAETAALRLLARAAHGSMRDALSLADQAIAFGCGNIEEAAVRQMLGSVDRSYVLRLIEALASGDGKTVVETSEALRTNGLSAATTLEDMCAALQRMAVYQMVPRMAAEVDATDTEAIELTRLCAAMPADETQLLYSICLQGRADLGLAPDEYAALTMVLLRLLAFKIPREKAVSPAASAEKKTLTPPHDPDQDSLSPQNKNTATAQDATTNPTVSAPGETGTNARNMDSGSAARAPSQEDDGPLPWEDDVSSMTPEPSALMPQPPQMPCAPPGEAVPAAQDADPGVASAHTPKTSQVWQDAGAHAAVLSAAPKANDHENDVFWHGVVQQLMAQKTITALVRELALQSQLAHREAGCWTLRTERTSLLKPNVCDRLQAALKEAGLVEKLTMQEGRVTDCPALRNAAQSAALQQAALEQVESDPLVQALIRDWDAHIVPHSIKVT